MKTTKSILMIAIITLLLSVGVFAKDKKQDDPLPTTSPSVETIDPKDKQILELKIAALSERLEKLQAQFAVTQQELRQAKSEYQVLIDKEQAMKNKKEESDGEKIRK